MWPGVLLPVYSGGIRVERTMPMYWKEFHTMYSPLGLVALEVGVHQTMRYRAEVVNWKQAVEWIQKQTHTWCTSSISVLKSTYEPSPPDQQSFNMLIWCWHKILTLYKDLSPLCQICYIIMNTTEYRIMMYVCSKCSQTLLSRTPFWLLTPWISTLYSCLIINTAWKNH